MKYKIEQDFFYWFCHWGIYDEEEKQQRIDDAYGQIMDEAYNSKIPRRGQVQKDGKKARGK